MRQAAAIACAVLLASCQGEQTSPAEVPTFNIDASRITVSGVSSGAMLATQMHIAHSALIGGAGLIAGGPYYCAEASVSKALGACMGGGELNLPALVDYARVAAAKGAIDPLSNLSGDAVWVLHGASDEVMHRDTANATSEFYKRFGVTGLVLVTDVPVAHGVPTLDTGAACDEMASPYLNACNYDAAGEMLSVLYGDLRPPGKANGELRTIAQSGAKQASMLPEAYLYIPTACREGAACGIHVAFHGCQQSSAFVGDAFAANAGYNEWAETNRLLVLYPQVDDSRFSPMNPMGCWDWWGYTDEHYATKQGAQIAAVKATLDLIAGGMH